LTPLQLLRELARPATDAGLLLALVVFSFLLVVANAAGLLGLWLAVIVIPAVYKYLLLVLYARAQGRPTPVPGIEQFNLADSLWSLAPLVLQCASLVGTWWLEKQGAALAALALGLGVLAVLPASLAILAITHSPAASLNPAAWWRMARACGPFYAVVPVAFVAAGAVLSTFGLRVLGAILPEAFALSILTNYPLFLLFTLTGAVLHARGVAFDVEIAAPTEGRADPAAALARTREDTLTHAYGFASRGNVSGALKHLEQAVAEDPDPASAWRFYCDQMHAWPSRDPALQLARSWLAWLLAQGREIEALKLLTRCLGENPAFRPWPADQPATLELVRRFQRDDLQQLLRGTSGADVS